ncbi:hypothetical protein PHLCEN_2v4069 [Hermanssonia centrifuga]|uniref:Uncharacterized protein n=1 Tax=Hermanssonia centrifuga TaxID=98765 RepID=A0A2R6Q5S3_9APHY|nr:hypothetical protein PHLCEN_2v4069 [Hermanssonia centrifuga]
MDFELEDVNEDGLYAYQQLNETFERELLAIDQISDRCILRAYAFKIRACLTWEVFAMLPFAYPGIQEESEEEVES